MESVKGQRRGARISIKFATFRQRRSLKTSSLNPKTSNPPTVEVESCSLGSDAKPIYSIELLGGAQLNAKPSEGGGDGEESSLVFPALRSCLS